MRINMPRKSSSSVYLSLCQKNCLFASDAPNADCCELQNRWGFGDLAGASRLIHIFLRHRVSAIVVHFRPAPLAKETICLIPSLK
jgi:hypothetical protein